MADSVDWSKIQPYLYSMKNPFAKEDGSPKKGQESAFIDWEKEQERKRLDKMSPKEKAAQKAADKNLTDKMES